MSTNELGSCGGPSTSGIAGCWMEVVLVEGLAADPARDVCSALHCAAFLRPVSSQIRSSPMKVRDPTESSLIEAVL